MHISSTPCMLSRLFGIYGGLNWVNEGYNIKYKVKFFCTTTFAFLVGIVTMY